MREPGRTAATCVEGNVPPGARALTMNRPQKDRPQKDRGWAPLSGIQPVAVDVAKGSPGHAVPPAATV